MRGSALQIVGRTTGSGVLAALALWANPALATIKGAGELGQCDPRYDTSKILEAAEGYPDPEIRVMSNAEYEAFAREMNANNSATDGRPMIEVAPPFFCNRQKEAYIVFRGRLTRNEPALTGGVEQQGEAPEEATGQPGGATPPSRVGTVLGPSHPLGGSIACQRNPQSYTCLYGHGEAEGSPGGPGSGTPPTPGPGGNGGGPPAPGPGSNGGGRPSGEPTNGNGGGREPSRPASETTGDCRAQVRVAAFDATVTNAFSSAPGNPDPKSPQPPPGSGPVLWLKAGFPGSEAITLRADVAISAGTLSPSDITIRFIQNATRYDGRLFWRDAPEEEVGFRTSRCSMDRLDMFRLELPPPPFYRANGGAIGPGDWSIEMHDSPSLGTVFLHSDDGHWLERVDVTYAYSTYLVCAVRDRPETIRTLERLDWEVRFAGDVLYAPPAPSTPPPAGLYKSSRWTGAGWAFALAPWAGVWADGRIRTTELPETGRPTFNECLQDPKERRSN